MAAWWGCVESWYPECRPVCTIHSVRPSTLNQRPRSRVAVVAEYLGSMCWKHAGAMANLHKMQPLATTKIFYYLEDRDQEKHSSEPPKLNQPFSSRDAKTVYHRFPLSRHGRFQSPSFTCVYNNGFLTNQYKSKQLYTSKGHDGGFN